MASKSSRGLNVLPFAGETFVTRQAKLSELVPPPPPPLLTIVKVGMTIEVGEERIKMIVEVGVGEGVSVFCVGVKLGVNVADGMAAAVCVEAALTVWAINVLTAPGLTVGTAGAANVGTHAMISIRAISQIINFVLRVASIFSFFHNRTGISMLAYFSTTIE